MDELHAPEIDPARRAELERQIDRYVRGLSALHPRSPAFHEMAAQLGDIGRGEAADLARLAERHLDQRRGAGLQAGVMAAIASLRRVMAELDPASYAHLLSERRVLGFRVRARPDEYFARFAHGQASIDGALSGLARGRDELHQSVIALEAQRADLHGAVERLGVAIESARMLGPRLEAAARELADPPLAEALRHEALYTVRQREADLLERMALGVQSEMALGIVSENAATLIQLSDKALATAMAVLRTVVVAARLLAQQDLVFRNIADLQGAATKLIEADGDPPPEEQIEAVQRAFAQLHNAIEDAAAFQQVAGAALSESASTLRP
jgi:hypothetical protein